MNGGANLRQVEITPQCTCKEDWSFASIHVEGEGCEYTKSAEGTKCSCPSKLNNHSKRCNAEFVLENPKKAVAFPFQVESDKIPERHCATTPESQHQPRRVKRKIQTPLTKMARTATQTHTGHKSNAINHCHDNTNTHPQNWLNQENQKKNTFFG